MPNTYLSWPGGVVRHITRGVLDRFKVRLALSRAATQSAPVLQPATEHVHRQIIGTGRDWKASPAVKPMPDDAESSATNARINKEALLERLDGWADMLQRHRQPTFLIHSSRLIEGGHLTLEQCGTMEANGTLDYAVAYWTVELEQGYAKRQNVTGREKVLPRLTTEEIADAREASRLATAVHARELAVSRRRDGPAQIAAQLRADADMVLVVNALGGEQQILDACHGDAVLAAQVKQKAREAFLPARSI